MREGVGCRFVLPPGLKQIEVDGRIRDTGRTWVMNVLESLAGYPSGNHYGFSNLADTATLPQTTHTSETSPSTEDRSRAESGQRH